MIFYDLISCGKPNNELAEIHNPFLMKLRMVSSRIYKLTNRNNRYVVFSSSGVEVFILCWLNPNFSEASQFFISSRGGPGTQRDGGRRLERRQQLQYTYSTTNLLRKPRGSVSRAKLIDLLLFFVCLFIY